MATSAIGTDPVAATTAIAPTTASKNEAGAADRFLKLLVAQMQNQDPLKPMDNAQVTSQMAQIQTVSGIERLNKSIESMSGSFSAMQNMQGASLVGRGVAIEGSALATIDEGLVGGGFELEGPAEHVRVQILSGAGTVLDTIDLGAQTSGRHAFQWEVPAGTDPALVASFKVLARAGGTEQPATPLMFDRVASVVTGGKELMLELQGGNSVPYSQIKSFH